MKNTKDIFIKVFKLRDNEFSEELTIEDIDSWDSISHMELILAIEDNYQLTLTGDDIADMTSVKAINQIIMKYTQS